MGILQARILEWVAMPSSRGSSWHPGLNWISCISCIGRWVLYHGHHLGNPTSVCCVLLISQVWLFAAPWTIACQASLSMGILQARILQWVALGDLPNLGIQPRSPHSSRILYHLSQQGSPRILEWVDYPFSRESSQPRNWTGSPELQGYSLPSEPLGKAQVLYKWL